MKAGIMSMQRVVNYGSCLQAYSLKQMLEEVGYEVEFVDYWVDPCIDCKTPLSKKLIIECKRAYLRLRRRLNLTKLFEPQAFMSAEDERLSLFQKVWTSLGITETRNLYPKLDLLVIGSDEVFNCLQDNCNVGYSLDLFGHRNRAKRLISYAGSFGNTTVERLRDYKVDKQIGRCFKRFDAISVRDNNSGSIVKTLTNKEPFYHLDPALVGDFSAFAKDHVTQEDYILVYGYGNRFTAQESEQICAYAEKVGKKILTLCGEQSFGEYLICSPDEILAYFQHAHAVITDTFHGSIFSIVTHRPFVACIRDSADGSYGNREKLEDMLIRTKMEHRILTDIHQLETLLQTPIDFTVSDAIQKEEREKSLAYLRKYCTDK